MHHHIGAIRFRVLLLLSCGWVPMHPLPCWGQITEPRICWTCRLKNAVSASPVPYPSVHPNSVIVAAGGYVTRIDGQGKPVFEIEFGPAGSNIGPETGLISVQGTNGATRWFGQTRHKAYMARTLIPVDGDAFGVLIGDKANSLVAYAADGHRLWQTQVRGHGVWTTPSVADVDGDGHQEIIVSVRDTSEQGEAWHVLDLHGRLLGSFKLPGGSGFGAPLVADINSDGVLEIVLASRSGQLTAFTFGGAAHRGSVFTTGWRGIVYQPAGASAKRPPSPSGHPRQLQLAQKRGRPEKGSGAKLED